MTKKEPITFRGVKIGDNVYRAKKQTNGTWNIETLKVLNKSVTKNHFHRIECKLSFEGTEKTIQTGVAVRIHVETLHEVYTPNIKRLNEYIQEMTAWEQRRNK